MQDTKKRSSKGKGRLEEIGERGGVKREKRWFERDVRELKERKEGMEERGRERGGLKKVGLKRYTLTERKKGRQFMTLFRKRIDD